MSSEAGSLPAWRLAAYGAVALPLAALTLPLYLVVPTFYAEALGVPLAVVGTILLAVRIFDAVNDPVIGWLADRWPARNRRKSWIALFALPLAATAYALFWPPADAGGAWLFGTAALLSIGYTAMVLPLSAWGAELSQDYHERSRIAAWREGFVIAGTVVAIALPFTIGWKDPSTFHGLALIAVFVVIALPLFTGVAVAMVPEPPVSERAGTPPFEAFAAMRANPHFIRLLSAFLINSLANALPATLFLLFVAQRLGAEEWRGPLLILYFVSAIAGMPFWTWVARRLSKHRSWCIAMLAACAVFLPAAFLSQGDVAAFTIICIASGLCLGADLVLPSSMQADVIESDRIASGANRSALFFAAWSLTSKLALALAVGLAFPLLEAYGLDATNSAASSNESLLMLALLYAAAPVALKLVAIAMMWNFRLDEAALVRMRKG
ncbi:MAG TPA: MFS transporter [Rhizobiaceae bacterium]|nr:MFS transporter [Rhizobiaceae bacterium]